jgi:hypothetical protein
MIRVNENYVYFVKFIVAIIISLFMGIPTRISVHKLILYFLKFKYQFKNVLYVICNLSNMKSK